MRTPKSYEVVFNDKTPLNVWPKIIYILRRIDEELVLLRPKKNMSDKFLKNWRYITAFLLVSKSFGKFTFSAQELATFDSALITQSRVKEVWNELDRSEFYNKQMGGWTLRKNVLGVCEVYAYKHGIIGIDMIMTLTAKSIASERRASKKSVTDEFIEKVKAVLPAQPWKPGIHRIISEQLKCETSEYFTAVERLIDDGVFLQQKDGVLYDTDGNVVSFDMDRVDPQTLELLPEKLNELL
jgi:hypothetical protein